MRRTVVRRQEICDLLVSVGHLKYIAEHESSGLPGTEDMAEEIYRGVEPGYDDYLDDILLQSEKAFQDDDFEDTSQSLLRDESSNHLNCKLACSNTISSSIGGDGTNMPCTLCNHKAVPLESHQPAP